MADLIKEVKEEETEIEIDTFNLRQQASSANQRKRKNTEKSDGSDSQKVTKGDQSWVFFGRNDAKAETLVLWPPHAKI